MQDVERSGCLGKTQSGSHGREAEFAPARCCRVKVCESGSVDVPARGL